MLEIDLQIATTEPIPAESFFAAWVKTTLQALHQTGAVCIRIVSIAEMSKLNTQYRHKNGPTNILSFPNLAPPEFSNKFLGDIVICAAIVNEGTISWAHIIIHGILHLLGYDHETETDAIEMETIEQRILALGA